jgi:hypothetical protein
VPTFSVADLMACLKPNHGYGESPACSHQLLFLKLHQEANRHRSCGFWRFLLVYLGCHFLHIHAALQVLQDMSEPQRRLFLRFLTGNPTLPAGGLHGLKPPITVVRRESDNSSISSDEYLPSVMTCVNYLKLPPYSSREVLAAKLHAAMSQGQAAFHLS